LSGARGVGHVLERARNFEMDCLPKPATFDLETNQKLINYGTNCAPTLPKVTPIIQKPKLIASNLLADCEQLCRASLENDQKRETLSRQNT
jgi:hypothetical protein